MSAVTVLSSSEPVKVYQDFSTIHLLSGGRAEIGAGRGSFIESFPLFGYDLKDYNELFEEINKEGQTILMVTHSANAASHAKRVLFIKDGRIFHQLYRGNKDNQEFNKDISLAMTTLLGGD